VSEWQPPTRHDIGFGLNYKRCRCSAVEDSDANIFVSAFAATSAEYSVAAPCIQSRTTPRGHRCPCPDITVVELPFSMRQSFVRMRYTTPQRKEIKERCLLLDRLHRGSFGGASTDTILLDRMCACGVETDTHDSR
jgi:hypothetical protein